MKEQKSVYLIRCNIVRTHSALVGHPLARSLHPSRFARPEAQFAQQINVNTGRPRGSGIILDRRQSNSTLIGE